MRILLPVIILPALVIGFFTLLVGLGPLLSPERIGRLIRDLQKSRWTFWHVMSAVAVAVLLFVFLQGGPHGEDLAATLLCLLVLVGFVRIWRQEFVFLMGLRDDDLPGRHDKLIWALMLIAMAPLGVWFFRSYRLAHWPEPKSTTYDGELGPEPAARGAAANPA